jgi:hypothetical protein
MNYRIVIPSLDRAVVLKTKTLFLLKNYNIPNHKIDILLSTKEEGEEYKKIIGNDYNLIYHGQKGIGAVRNFIKHYYKYKTDLECVVYIDDDIEAINQIDKPVENLDYFIEFMFYKTYELGLNLWGICCFDNPYFLKKSISTNLKYICGGFCGEIIDRKKYDIYTDFDHFEDFAFSCEHFIRDGGVVRNNEYCVITKNFAEGGIVHSYNGLENRKKDMEKASKYFIERFGDMARIKIKKYGFDIRLNHNYKHESC